jgi:hypothetical protein
MAPQLCRSATGAHHPLSRPGASGRERAAPDDYRHELALGALSGRNRFCWPRSSYRRRRFDTPNFNAAPHRPRRALAHVTKCDTRRGKRQETEGDSGKPKSCKFNKVSRKGLESQRFRPASQAYDEGSIPFTRSSIFATLLVIRSIFRCNIVQATLKAASCVPANRPCGRCSSPRSSSIFASRSPQQDKTFETCLEAAACRHVMEGKIMGDESIDH